MRRRTSVVKLADEQVPILFACRLIGMDLPDMDSRSAKVRCPFGEVYHSDQGAEAAFRIYPDNNSAWCFSCAYFYTPTRLIARAWDIPAKDAASILLERSGYRPPSDMDVWTQLVEPPPVDRTALAEALKTYCTRTVHGWAEAQYTRPLAVQLDRCLRLLDLVHDEAGGRRWLAGSKLAMLHAAATHPNGVPSA